jgi:lysine-specific histone demethylase 1
VRLRHAVTRVARTAAGVRVEVKRPDGGAMALEAEIVICSLPLGVLKAATCPVFDPPLPPRKLQAVERLGFGTLNKVLLVFDRPFWERAEGKRDFWGITARRAPGPDPKPIRNPTPHPHSNPNPNPDRNPNPNPNPTPNQARSARERGVAFQFWNMQRCTGRPMLLAIYIGLPVQHI